jgi:hypothetical protein
LRSGLPRVAIRQAASCSDTPPAANPAPKRCSPACTAITRLNALRYQGAADFITAIEVAQQLRHRGARAPFDLAVLARPDDARLGNTASSFDGDAPHVWVECGAADVAGATDAVDAQGTEIAQALRMAAQGRRP